MYYTKCIQIQTLKYTSHCIPCVHLWSIHFVVYNWNLSVYKKYTFLYTFCIVHELPECALRSIHFVYIYRLLCVASMLSMLIWNRIVHKRYTSQKVCLLGLNCFGFNVIYTFYRQNIDCNLLNQHNNCIQKLYKVYTCCIWLVLICTWICDLHITVNFEKVEYKLYNYCIIMNKTYKWPFSFLLGLFSQKPLRSFLCCFYKLFQSNRQCSII